MDWKPRIGLVLKIQEQIRSVDTLGMYKYGIPERGSSEDGLVKTETTLSTRLPSDYRDFLKQSGGWRGFFQNIYLFGANDLTGGERRDRANAILGECIKPRGSTWLPIGVSDATNDVLAANMNSWEFCWFQFEIIESRNTFVELFDLFIACNRKEAIELPKLYEKHKNRLS